VLRNPSDVFVLPRYKVEGIRQQQDENFARLGIPVGSKEFHKALKRFEKIRNNHPERSGQQIFDEVLRGMREEGLIQAIEIKPKEKFSLKKFFLGKK